MDTQAEEMKQRLIELLDDYHEYAKNLRDSIKTAASNDKFLDYRRLEQDLSRYKHDRWDRWMSIRSIGIVLFGRDAFDQMQRESYYRICKGDEDDKC